MLKSLRKKPVPDKADDLIFDEIGIPHGETRVQVLSTLGTIMRSKAKVYAPKWKMNVPDNIKDLIFEELRVL